MALCRWPDGTRKPAGRPIWCRLPYVENPKTGFVATANNKVYADGAGPFLTVDWLDGYRAARIVEALQERNDWDLAGWSLLLSSRCPS